MSGRVYDVAIIGSGPAGLSAAVYAGRARLHTLVIEQFPMSGGQVINTVDVDNYLGLKGIEGFEMAMKFREHADSFGAEFVTASVRSLRAEEPVKTIVCAEGEYQARTVILATGATHRKLGVPGEEELAAKGVSYCATCDGAFFRGKTVAVVGGGDVAVEDALYLAKLCDKVYVIHRRDTLRANKAEQEALFALSNIEMVWNTEVVSIEGSGQVEGARVRNNHTGEVSLLPLDGVFIAVGITPNSEPFRGVVEMDKGGFIIAGEEGVTSAPGVFAAGDIRTKALRQIVTAVADGANAVYAAEGYLSTHPLV